MNERIFLDRAIEELEQLTEENKELKRQVSLYEKFVKDVKELLSEGDNKQCGKMNIPNT